MPWDKVLEEQRLMNVSVKYRQKAWIFELAGTMRHMMKMHCLSDVCEDN